MMHFKNHKTTGMTFVEVILSVLIIGMILTSLLGLQSSAVNAIQDYSSRLSRIFLLKNAAFDSAQQRAKNEKKDNKKKTVEIENPKTTITIMQSRPHEKSSLKSFGSIVIETLTATWYQFLVKKEETFISFVYKPKEQEA